MGDDYTMVGAIGAIISVLVVLVAIPAVVLGAIGVTRPGLPRIAAGIGLGIGAAELWAQLIWFFTLAIPS